MFQKIWLKLPWINPYVRIDHGFNMNSERVASIVNQLTIDNPFILKRNNTVFKTNGSK